MYVCVRIQFDFEQRDQNAVVFERLRRNFDYKKKK